MKNAELRGEGGSKGELSDGADRRDQRAKRFQAGTVSYLCCTGATLPDNSRVYISIEKCLYLFTRLLLLFLPYGPVPVVYVLDNQILLGRRKKNKKTLENRRLGTIVVVLLRNLILLFCLVFFKLILEQSGMKKKSVDRNLSVCHFSILFKYETMP